MSILCTICARGGSKSLPGKNIRPLNGIPLIAHSIRHAKESGVFDCIAVSSDSDEILAVAKQYGADMLVKRPDELATDEAGKIPSIIHALQAAEAKHGKQYELVVELEATSPLRSPADIIASVQLQKETTCSNVFTVAPAYRSPYFNLVECDEKGVARLCKPPAQNLQRRQDSTVCYDINGSVYVWTRDALMNQPRHFYEDTRVHVMPRERSVDINDELDFTIAEAILARGNKA